MADDTLDTAARIMREIGVGCVPVVDRLRRPIGLITQRDICIAAYTTARVLATIPVRCIMRRRVASCTPDSSLAEAEALLRREQVECLPVVGDDGTLIGTVRLGEVVCHMPSGRAPMAEPASEQLASLSDG